MSELKQRTHKNKEQVSPFLNRFYASLMILHIPAPTCLSLPFSISSRPLSQQLGEKNIDPMLHTIVPYEDNVSRY